MGTRGKTGSFLVKYFKGRREKTMKKGVKYPDKKSFAVHFAGREQVLINSPVMISTYHPAGRMMEEQNDYRLLI